MSEEDMKRELLSRGFLPLAQIEDQGRKEGGREGEKEGGKGEGKEGGREGEYGYLLDMPIHSLTEERALNLAKSAEMNRSRLLELLSRTPQVCTGIRKLTKCTR